MGLLCRQRLWGRFRKEASLALCGLAFLALPVWAQAPPQLPANSDIAIRILPTRADKLELTPEMMKEQPLIRLITSAAESYLELDLVDDFGGAFDGTLVAAILSDPKHGSSLASYIKDDELRAERRSLVEELQALASDLESYKEEQGSYPTDYRTYIDEHRYYEPYMPPGASYEYKPLNGGEGFRLVATFSKTSALAGLGPAPTFGHDGKEENVEPTAPRKPLNYVFGARVTNPELAKKIATKLAGTEPKSGFWYTESPLPMNATLRGEWLVVSDKKSHLGPFLKSLQGQGPTLAKDPDFQMVARNIDTNAPLVAFADLPALLKGVDMSGLPDMRNFLNVAGPVGYAITPLENSQVRMEAFVGTKAPKGSALEKLLADSATANPESAMVVGNIPWDVSNAFAVDYRVSKRLFDAFLGLSADATESWGLVEDVWAGYFGLDAEAGFSQLLDGWVVVSFERIDIFVNAFEGFFDAMETYSVPAEYDPDAVDEDYPDASESDLEGAADDIPITVTISEESDSTSVPEGATAEAVESVSEEVDSEITLDPEEDLPLAQLKPPRIPFTVAFQVVDSQAKSALMKVLTEQLGEETKTTNMSGVEAVGRRDGLLTYAVQDNWFYLSGGNTQRLMRNLLAAATGQKETLTSLESWSAFRKGQRGQVLAIGHQKLDSLYSMTKGFLLFLGPEFRPLAYELGNLRDYHSAVFIVPDGFLCVGDILQGDGR